MPIDSEIKTADFAELTGLSVKEVRQLANDEIALKASRRGYLKFADSVQGILSYYSSTEAKQKKEDLTQRKRDLDNSLREYELLRERGAFMDATDAKKIKTSYVAKVVKQHVAWEPRMRRQFPDLPKAVFDYCWQELTQIREQCKTNLRPKK